MPADVRANDRAVPAHRDRRQRHGRGVRPAARVTASSTRRPGRSGCRTGTRTRAASARSTSAIPIGHFLEIICISRRARASDSGTRRDRLFLGIDHTAIVVDDTERSRCAFYRDTLGMAGRRRERELRHRAGAPEQRLRRAAADHGAARRTRGPASSCSSTSRRATAAPAPADLRANDIAHWQTTVIVPAPERMLDLLRSRIFGLVSPTIVTLSPPTIGVARAVLLRDPDGHALRVATR